MSIGPHLENSLSEIVYFCVEQEFGCITWMFSGFVTCGILITQAFQFKNWLVASVVNVTRIECLERLLKKSCI